MFKTLPSFISPRIVAAALAFATVVATTSAAFAEPVRGPGRQRGFWKARRLTSIQAHERAWSEPHGVYISNVDPHGEPVGDRVAVVALGRMCRGLAGFAGKQAPAWVGERAERTARFLLGMRRTDQQGHEYLAQEVSAGGGGDAPLDELLPDYQLYGLLGLTATKRAVREGRVALRPDSFSEAELDAGIAGLWRGFQARFLNESDGTIYRRWRPAGAREGEKSFGSAGYMTKLFRLLREDAPVLPTRHVAGPLAEKPLRPVDELLLSAADLLAGYGLGSPEHGFIDAAGFVHELVGADGRRFNQAELTARAGSEWHIRQMAAPGGGTEVVELVSVGHHTLAIAELAELLRGGSVTGPRRAHYLTVIARATNTALRRPASPRAARTDDAPPAAVPASAGDDTFMVDSSTGEWFGPVQIGAGFVHGWSANEHPFWHQDTGLRALENVDYLARTDAELLRQLERPDLVLQLLHRGLDHWATHRISTATGGEFANLRRDGQAPRDERGGFSEPIGNGGKSIHHADNVRETAERVIDREEQ